MSLSLSVLAPRGGPWRAEVVEPDGTRHAFDSPFELARWLARPAPAAACSAAPAADPAGGGLG
jgi:hypothetical protein